ncbi:MAG: hypothetical protein J3K34DRAFT_456831 [Monoraphidium minutum]|nr:MAG: hypothetical protein J3K34DRAFT_456831 [Monoraphidium minutum]
MGDRRAPVVRIGFVLGLLYACVLSAGPARAAFLQQALPLEPVVSTPAELLTNETADIILWGRMSLMAVFSRPVIALGSDFGQATLPASMVPFTLGCPVPGLGRWVTTTIYRFDASIEWPPDLDCAFKWNTALKTFDGAPLVLSSQPTHQLVTAPMTFDVIDVSSKLANEVTDDQWSAYRGMADDNFPEVPPDGNVTLSFSYPVVLSSLQSALKVTSCCSRDDGRGRSLKVLPCGPPFAVPDPFAAASKNAMAANSTCAVIQITPGLGAGQVVALSLQKGATYNPVAGKARAASKATYLWGLRKFRIPLRDNFQQLTGPNDTFGNAHNGVWYRRVLMWLPHGLAAGTRASDLVPQIAICKYKDAYKWSSPCQPVKFYLERVNKGKLLMRVPSFSPRDHYQLRVKASPNIKDGFGLPLQASEAFFYTTDPNPDFSWPELAGGGSLVILEPAAGSPPLQWPVVSRGSPRWDSSDPAGAAAWGLDAKSYPAALEEVWYSMPMPTKLGGMSASLKRSSGALASFGALTLSGAPGLQLVANTLRGSAIKGSGDFSAIGIGQMYVCQSALQYTSVMMGTQMTAWVTDTRAVPPPAVANAEVTVFLASYGQAPTKGPSCVTAANGTCTIDLKELPQGMYLLVLVQAAGHGLLMVNGIDTPYVRSSDDSSGDAGAKWSGQLVLDRALVQPGDSLHITGYLQARGSAGLSLSPASLTSATLSISPAWAAAESGPTRVTVAVDPAFGSFHANLSVPASAQLVPYEVSLQLPSKAGGSGASDDVSVASESFQVADPRPPTAVLNLTAPDWAHPTSAVKALIKVTSYLGADVSDAVIRVTWTVPLATGAVNIATDARGRAVVLIPLGDLPKANATKLGDSLEIKASWVGPTGDVYDETASVKMAEGPVDSYALRSPATDAPGVPFVVAARTSLNDGAGTLVEGVSVAVLLKPASPGALANCSASEKAALARQRCVAVSGAPPVKEGGGGAACTLVIPCTADLLIETCALSFANGTKIKGGAAGGPPPCSRSPLGRNTSAWAAAPWAFQPALSLLKDRANYTLGSTATLSFALPPYTGAATGIVMWGGASGRRTKALPRLAPGPNGVSLGPLGGECRGGCKAVVVISVGRNLGKSDLGRLPKVPTSKLFDPLAPYTLSDSISLTVLADNRLDVTVAVEGDGGLRTRAGGKAVAAPLGGAAITVDVKDATTGKPTAGAQVTLVVVDQAVLDLMPYNVKDLAGLMSPDDDTYLRVNDVNANRASRRDINTTFSVLRRRLAIDPWLPLDTTITPSRTWDIGAWGSAPYYPTTNPVDVPDSLYIPRFSTRVTVTPSHSWGITQRYPAVSRSTADDGAAALRLSGQFQTVPLFKTVIAGPDGRAAADFEAPANLGAFSVRAYVVSRGAAGAASAYGANETQLVVRLPVSLTPALPRMVRVGDVFEAGVLVSAPDAGAAPITVTITVTVTRPTAELADPEGAAAPANGSSSIALLPRDPFSREAALSASRQQAEVRFRFSASEVGSSGVRFDAYLKGSASKASDSAAYDIPVLGRQGPVFLATSFALQPGTGLLSAGQTEGLALPEADPGSGTVDLVAGVGNLPFLQTTYESLVSELTRDPTPYAFAPTAVAAATLPGLLARYTTSEAAAAPAWASNATQANASSAAVTQITKELSDPEFGLLYFNPRQQDGSVVDKPDRVAVPLNAWAAWMVGEAAEEAAGNEALAYLKPLEAAAASWRAAVGREVTSDAKMAREASPPVNWYGTPNDLYGTPEGTQPRPGTPNGWSPRYNNFEALSWARLALGVSWVPDTTDQGIKDDVALPRLVAAIKTPGFSPFISVGTAARTGLALLASKDAAAARDAAAIAKVLQNQIRVQGRTAYIAASAGSWSWAWFEDQAWALALLTATAPKAGAASAVVQKLAAGVARGPRQAGAGALCAGADDQEAGAAAAALARYDGSRGSTAPNARVTVAAANAAGASKTLLDARFTPAAAGRTQAASTPWGALPPNASTLDVKATGRGEVSLAAGLTFTPAALLPFPTYRGLWVERVVQSEGGAGSLGAVPAGQIVTVTVQITTPDDLGQVVIEVLMPGGLEPIDPSVYKDTSSSLLCGMWGGGWRSWWCPRLQLTTSLVRIDYYTLPAGTASISFKAAAATPGTFALPPVKAYAVAQPEVMGLSAAGSFVVCPAARPASAAPLVKDPGFGAADDDARFAGGAGVTGAGGANTAVFGPVPAVCGSAAAAARPPVAPARGCPKDCSGNGVCNLSSGACICNQGFGGADCGKLASS